MHSWALPLAPHSPHRAGPPCRPSAELHRPAPAPAAACCGAHRGSRAGGGRRQRAAVRGCGRGAPVHHRPALDTAYTVLQMSMPPLAPLMWLAGVGPTHPNRRCYCGTVSHPNRRCYCGTVSHPHRRCCCGTVSHPHRRCCCGEAQLCVWGGGRGANRRATQVLSCAEGDAATCLVQPASRHPAPLPPRSPCSAGHAAGVAGVYSAHLPGPGQRRAGLRAPPRRAPAPALAAPARGAAGGGAAVDARRRRSVGSRPPRWASLWPTWVPLAAAAPTAPNPLLSGHWWRRRRRRSPLRPRRPACWPLQATSSTRCATGAGWCCASCGAGRRCPCPRQPCSSTPGTWLSTPDLRTCAPLSLAVFPAVLFVVWLLFSACTYPIRSP